MKALKHSDDSNIFYLTFRFNLENESQIAEYALENPQALCHKTTV